MKSLPETEDALVLRTDFSDDAAWEAIQRAITEPVGPEEFRAYVEFLSREEDEDARIEDILTAAKSTDRTFLFVIDRATFASPEWPILCVDLSKEPGRSFRVVPSEMWGVENNLSLANMDFGDFANAVEQDGIFRGFQDD